MQAFKTILSKVNPKIFIPICFIILGFGLLTFFMNCSNFLPEDPQSFINPNAYEDNTFIGASTNTAEKVSTSTTEEVNKNCDYTVNNGCHSGVLRDIPDINQTLRWECKGSYGTANCAKANLERVCGFDEEGGYCLDGQHTDIPETTSHHWFKCTATDGVITYCSLPKNGVEDGHCDNTANNECLSGSRNDIPDINRIVKWQCQGQNGGLTADCNRPADAFACGFDEEGSHCLDGEREDLPSTSTHNWFSCTETDGKVTHCSTSRESFVNGTCGGDEEGPYCLDGDYNIVEETDSYWKYTCGGLNGGTSTDCFLCKNSPHFGAKNETCLPSCGHAKNLYCQNNNCTGFAIARDNQCSRVPHATIYPLETYEERACCLRKENSATPAPTFTPHPPISTVTPTPDAEAVDGACGGDEEGSYCLDGVYSLIEETEAHWKYSCSGINGGASEECLQCKNHYQEVNQTCIPSCGHAFSLYCKTHDCGGLDHKNGQANCNNPTGWEVIEDLTAYDGPCCVRRRQ